MSLGDVLDLLGAALVLLGCFLCFAAALGVVRFPDVVSRMHAATKPQTLGLTLVLLGTALRVELVSAVTLVLVVLFQVITAPVLSQIVGRAAYRSGAVDRGRLVADELAAHLPPDAPATGAGVGDAAGERDGATS